MLTRLTELTFYRVDNVNYLYICKLFLAKPGEGAASLSGEISQESALPASLFACRSGGWLGLLEVHIVGSVQYMRLAVYSSQKTHLL